MSLRTEERPVCWKVEAVSEKAMGLFQRGFQKPGKAGVRNLTVFRVCFLVCWEVMVEFRQRFDMV